MLALLIANNSINRSLLETTENNSLARAFTKQQREVGMAARCGMLIRGQWDGPVIVMKWDEMRLLLLMGNLSYNSYYYCASSA